MIKYAIISDIHGNLEALNAVINDMKTQGVDRVICLGDIVSKGVHGHECVELVRQIADAVVKGNNDITYSMSLDEIASIDAEFDYDYFMWTQKQLTTDDIAYLRELPLCCELMLSGRRVRCFHATPSDPDRTVFNFSSYGEKLKLFQPTEYTTSAQAEVVIFGHSHHLSMEKFFGKMLINSGSVGNSLNIFNDPTYNSAKINDYTMAEYVILSGEDGKTVGEIGVELRSVPYDKEKELDSFPNNKYKEAYLKEIMFGEYRFPERIKASFDAGGVAFD